MRFHVFSVFFKESNCRWVRFHCPTKTFRKCLFKLFASDFTQCICFDRKVIYAIFVCNEVCVFLRFWICIVICFRANNKHGVIVIFSLAFRLICTLVVTCALSRHRWRIDFILNQERVFLAVNRKYRGDVGFSVLRVGLGESDVQHLDRVARDSRFVQKQPNKTIIRQQAFHEHQVHVSFLNIPETANSILTHFVHVLLHRF